MRGSGRTNSAHVVLAQAPVQAAGFPPRHQDAALFDRRSAAAARSTGCGYPARQHPFRYLSGRAIIERYDQPSTNDGHPWWPLAFSIPLFLAIYRSFPLFPAFSFTAMDINKQLAALTTSELQTAGASQATAIAVSVLLRHLQSPELAKLLSGAFENHQAVMLQTPWPDQMLQSFEATRRFLEGAARPPVAGDAPSSAS
jgi:hypothetical protein